MTKQPKCPECGEEIGRLRYSAKRTIFGDFSLNPDKSWGDYDEDCVGDVEDTEYFCPECDDRLFSSEDNAYQFLKNEDELAVLIKDTLNGNNKK